MLLYSTYQDEQLLTLLRQGDEKAFSEIYLRYRYQLSAYAINLVNNQEDALDIIQEVFTAIWKRHDQIEITHSPKAYLYKGIRNGCLRHIENSVRHTDFLNGLSIAVRSTGVSPENSLDIRELQHQVALAVSNMPDKMKEVFQLSHEQNLSHKEIGIRLGIAENTAKKHIQNALKLIKGQIGSVSGVLIPFISQLFK